MIHFLYQWTVANVHSARSYFFYRGGKGPTKGLVVTKRGGKAKGAVMMIFFHPLAILHEVLLSTFFAPFETQIAKKLSTSEPRF